VRKRRRKGIKLIKGEREREREEKAERERVIERWSR
jgi:hypothetical protein